MGSPLKERLPRGVRKVRKVVRFTPRFPKWEGVPGLEGVRGPHEKQKEFIRASRVPQYQTIFLSSGVQLGKTVVGAYELGMAVQNQKEGSPLSWIIAPNFRFTGRATKTFIDMWRPLIISYKKAANEIHLLMPAGLKDKYPNEPYVIKIISAYDSDALRADPIAFAWIDEAPLCPEHAYGNALGRVSHARAISKTLGKIFLTGTPQEIDDLYVQPWIKDQVIDPFERGAEDIKIIYARTEDSPRFKTPAGREYYLKWREKLGEQRAAMEMDGEYIRVASVLLPEFNETVHVISPFEVPESAPVFAGVDPGYGSDPMACVWLTHLNHRFYVLDEVYVYKSYPTAVAEAVMANKLHDRCEVYYVDASDQATQNEWYAKGIHTVSAPRNKEIAYTELREALKTNEDKEPGLKIFEHCRELLREISRCHIPPRGLKGLKNNHAIDAVFYGIKGYLGSYRGTTKAPLKGPYSRFESLLQRGMPVWMLPPSVHKKMFGNANGYISPVLREEVKKKNHYGEYFRTENYSHD